MCLGSIAHLVELTEEEGTRVGLLEDGTRVSLAFVPGASVGDHLLVHLGIPVEVLAPEDAREAAELRAGAGPGVAR